jgi:hypothetical protein
LYEKTGSFRPEALLDYKKRFFTTFRITGRTK